MRIKPSVASRKRRKKQLKRAKGFARSLRLYRKSKENLLKAGAHAYRGRKEKKRVFKRLWITRLSAALQPFDLNYSRFIKKLKDEKIQIDRKLLSEIAIKDEKTFAEIVKKVL